MTYNPPSLPKNERLLPSDIVFHASDWVIPCNNPRQAAASGAPAVVELIRIMHEGPGAPDRRFLHFILHYFSHIMDFFIPY